MKTTTLNRLLSTTALAAALALLPAAASALPVLFGEASVDGVTMDVANIEPGQTVTATTLLQLVAPDGSIITVEPGSVFTMTGEGDSLSFELVSGAMRVASSGTPISVSRGGVTVTTEGGVFSAYGNDEGGLDGRVNQGTATVQNGSGTREFARGEGYEASETSLAGTFTPPVPGSTQLAQQTGPDDDTNYSPADQQGSGGSQIVEEAAGGGSGGGGSYGGTPPVTGVVVPLEGDEEAGYSVVYAADAIGIDARDPAKVTIGANGELNQYDVEPDFDERLERNSNESLERGNSGNAVFIERWAGGETRGNYYNSNNGTFYSDMGRTSHQGFHIAYGKPTVDMPAAGVATYALAAATNPTIDDGSFAPGSFSGEMSVLFGATLGIGIDFDIDMPGDHLYNIRTPGGVGSPTTGGIYWDNAARVFRLSNIAMSQGGAACPTANCNAVVYGLFGGTDASDIGVSYQIMDFSIAPDSLGRAKRISGAAAFSQASYDAGGGPDTPLPMESGAVDALLVASPGTTKWHGGVYYIPQINFSSGKSLGMQNDIVAWGDDGAVTFIQATETSLASFDRGTAVTADLYGTEYLQIGRWNGGDIDVYMSGDQTFSPNGYQGIVYLVGNMLGSTLRPESITATYDLAGATAPIFAGGNFAPGVFDGTAAIQFGASNANAKMGLNATVTMDEGDDIIVYNISTTGGTATPGTSEIDVFGSQISGSYQVQAPNGAACSGSAVNCNVSIQGLLAGPQAREAGIRYAVGNTAANSIYGAAIFARDDVGDTLDGYLMGMTYAIRSPQSGVLAGSFGDISAGATDITIIANEVKEIHGFNNSYAPGDATVSEVGGVQSVVSWQRWSDGLIGGESFGNPRTTVLGEDQGMHVLAWSPATNLPSEGVATYTLAGATNPTVADGSLAPGSFAGEMAVAFGFNAANTKIGLDLDVSIGGHTYNIATTGGTATPGSSQVSLSNFSGFSSTIDVATGGVACPDATCQAKVAGALAGSGASHAALAYTISANGNPTAKAVQGVAGFERGPIVLP
ncbi:hypothetical protein Plav_1899 [Parvibaculum lavamentivorans DS-1]|uniref:FecR protein domain-containing protein n=1 Tax=Parvibaculum lavamentivorans (strain DS-1 / DSM 13023 / NCIMB 13966) TaxID=402881 RepID=A7HUD1_PARL1|nr:hypothetical protein [Parvibaculum lavamentivorans]ABS63514.1 hypothetical protein Plav_1899 [Parvibaculum lavamentivorans DS-1]